MGKVNPQLRERLLSRMDFLAEYTDLLGPPKGGSIYVRRCVNSEKHKNGDKSPSLGFSKDHGGYKCFTCGLSGDIFDLRMRVKGEDFPTAFKHFLVKYGLSDEIHPTREQRKRESNDFPWKPIAADKLDKFKFIANLPWQADKLRFMFTRYGLTLETLKEWRIAYNPKTNRVEIPIWLDRKPSNHIYTSIANVKQHDVFRVHCQWINEETHEVSNKRPPGVDFESIMAQTTAPWHAAWNQDKKFNKALSITGHGCVYVYPFEAFHDPRDIYLVAGEFKVLLLRQMGFNAMCWTGGEKSSQYALLGYFLGRTVYVLYDPDTAGVEGAEAKAQELADNGANVFLGIWNPDILKHPSWPYKGDINDLCRLTDYSPAILHDPLAFTWKKVERKASILEVEAPQIDPDFVEDETPLDLMSVPFDELINPATHNQWVRTEALISGRSAAPFAVPSTVHVTCKEGQRTPQPKCQGCGVLHNGFSKTVRYTVLEQVDFCGQSVDKIDGWIAQKAGVPKGCHYPILDKKIAAVDMVVLSPSANLPSSSNMDEVFDAAMQFQHSRRPAYLLSTQGLQITQNSTYELGGKVISDPKKGIFTFAITRYRSREKDITHWDCDPERDERLYRMMENGPSQVVADLRDNVCQIFGQDHMLTIMLLTYFLPFTFTIKAKMTQERICPTVLILGETLTGKSTVIKNLVKHFGIGRYSTADTKLSVAGLIGGNYDQRTSAFAWGLLPSSHRTLVALDEFQKAPDEIIGSLTNLISSGVAERILNSGPNQCACWVRLMYMANPRGKKPLAAFSNPMEAAIGVMTTPQDLGRLDLCFIQKKALDSIFDDPDMFTSNTPHLYDRDLARYHLNWAWSRKPTEIVFQDPDSLISRANLLAREIGTDLPLLLPSAARFKLARISAGFALMLYSKGERGECLVTNRHVDMAIQLYRDIYLPYTRPEKGARPRLAGALHPDLLNFFDRMGDPHDVMADLKWRRIQILLGDGGWTWEDLIAVFGTNEWTEEFLNIAMFKANVFTRIGRKWHSKLPSFSEGIEQYVRERDKAEDSTYDPRYSG